jgi:kumamolisin
VTDIMITLKGSVPVNKHKRIGPADPHERVEITIVLERKSEDGLPTLEEFLRGKRSKGLTRQQLAEKHGAKPEDAEAVKLWAGKQGLSVLHSDLGSRLLHLVGSVAALSRAFGVKMSMYHHSRTQTKFRCPESDIQIPKKLASAIAAVFGLNDMPVVVRHTARTLRRSAASSPQDQFPGTFFPNEVAQLYNFPPTQGQGQRVAILEFGGGFDPAVLASYFTNQIGLSTPPSVNAIPVLGTKMQLKSDATVEVYLDIEVVGAMAPQATIDVFFAPWTGQGFYNAITQAIHNDDYAAVSISYGLDEDLAGSPGNEAWPQLYQQTDEVFRDAVAIGIPVFVSSGDQGSSSLRGELSNREEVTAFSPDAHAGYPASSPYATAVGGTLLYAANGQISQEVVWNELGQVQTGPYLDELGQPQNGNYYLGGATGGGVSDRYPVPSYQSSAGINPTSANSPSVTGRGVPDVSGNSGETTGYLITVSAGLIRPVGGTSAAAPMWAALMACVRSALNIQYYGDVPVFFFNDFVYASGTTAAFRDILGGRNFTFDSGDGPIPGDFIPIGNNRSTGVNAYNAAQGFDLCTGWGSPNGNALLTQLAAWLTSHSSSPTPPPSPTT